VTKKKWLWIGSIFIVLVIGLIIFFFKNSEAKMVGNDLNEMGITVQKASNQELSESILVTGKIVPESEQKLYWESEKGEIIEFKVEENQIVSAGDPLFVYDSSNIDTEYNKVVRERDLLKSRGKTEQKQIADFNNRIADAKKKLDSQNNDLENVVTEDDVNQLTNEKIQLEIQYESTKAEIDSIQEQINEKIKQKKEMTVVSKMDGIVVKVNRNIEKNEAGTNEPVVHVISNSPYKVIGSMSEFDTVKIQKDQEVIIRPKVYKDREWKGVVESVSHFPEDTGDGSMGEMYNGGGSVTMYPFKVAITDDTSELRQGFHVSLEIKVSGQEKSLVVPHMALIQEEGINIVYTLVDGKLERREVDTGAMNEEFIEIKQGITLDELVVITPNDGMYDGMEVTIFDEIE